MARSLATLVLGAVLSTFVSALPSLERSACAAELDRKGKSDAKEAMRFYKEGNYEDAAKLFLRLSISYPDMLVFVRNLGACYYYMRRYEPALSNLRDYLHRKADIAADDRAEVSGWIGEMERLRDQAAAPAAPPAAATRAPAPASGAGAAPVPTVPVPVPAPSAPTAPTGPAASTPAGPAAGSPAPAPTVPPAAAAGAPAAPEPVAPPGELPGAGPTGYPPSSQPPYAPQSPYGAPSQGQYGAPPPGQYGAPLQGQYGAPPQGQYGAPPPGQYGTPPQGQYGAPTAPGPYGPQPTYPPQGQYPPSAGPGYAPATDPPGYAPAGAPPAGPAPVGVAAAEAAPPPSTGSGRKVGAWLLGITGVAIAGTGGVLTYLSQSKFDKVETKYDPSQEKTGKNLAIGAGVCYGVGGAALLTAIILGATGGSSSGQASLAPAVGPGVAGATLSGRF